VHHLLTSTGCVLPSMEMIAGDLSAGRPGGGGGPPDWGGGC
jgi:hypothetical protein